MPVLPEYITRKEVCFLANSLNSRKKSGKFGIDELDKWRAELDFIREEITLIRHPTPIGTTSEEVIHEHSC